MHNKCVRIINLETICQQCDSIDQQELESSEPTISDEHTDDPEQTSLKTHTSQIGNQYQQISA